MNSREVDIMNTVYQTMRDKSICDDITYINPDNSYKITEFLEGACDRLTGDRTKLTRIPGWKDKIKYALRRKNLIKQSSGSNE